METSSHELLIRRRCELGFDAVRSPTELTEAFRQRGLKVTPQRLAIFQALHHHTGHPSAESVYAQVVADMPTVSLRTVYQTLNDLADMGELQQLTFGAGPSRFDPNTDGHHHLVCEMCGRVRDVYVDAAPVLAGPAADGYRITATEIVFRGVCDECSTS